MKVLRKGLKTVLGRHLLARDGLRDALGDAGVVAAFHRIDDRYPRDPISESVERFKSFCSYFKRYHDVVGFSDFLDDLDAGRSIAGKLVITFDDGYLDNYEVAAPILARMGLPATFFIATGFIGSTFVPWWDAAAGIRSQWMTWDQVRELRDMGFELGSHTVNHLDLGVISPEEARREICGSMEDLRERTGTDVSLFAFPYGRPENLSPGNLEVVQELRLRCAPSCFGGIVLPGDDPYRLHRAPINRWYLAPAQFAWEITR